MSVRLEYYGQTGNIPSSALVGSQGDREVYPDLDAIIFQYSYHFGR